MPGKLFQNTSDFMREYHQMPTLTPDKTTWHIAYALMILGFFFGITWILAFIWILLRKKDVEHDPCLFSHAMWQQQTLIYGLIGLVASAILVLIGFITMIFLIGFVFFALSGLLSFCLALWFLYRVIKGWVDLTYNRIMPL